MPRIRTLKREGFERDSAWNHCALPDFDVEISGDYRRDIGAAVEFHHDGHDDACDICAAMDADCPLSAARLLSSATETPMLDAVHRAHRFNGTAVPDRVSSSAPNMGWMPDDWDEYVAHFEQYGRECAACGAFTFADPSAHGAQWGEPERCGNCLDPIRRHCAGVPIGYEGAHDQAEPDADGKLPRSIDGEGLIYRTADGGTLCADCANGENGSDATTRRHADDQWRIIGADFADAGAIDAEADGTECEAPRCDHCAGTIDTRTGETTND